MTSSIQEMCSTFVDDLRTAIEAEWAEKMLAAVRSSNIERPRSPAPRVTGVASASAIAKKPRKKGPIQLCPVPRCKERAAPVFHMLCGKHKDTSKKLVAQYRAARRARSK